MCLVAYNKEKIKFIQLVFANESVFVKLGEREFICPAKITPFSINQSIPVYNNSRRDPVLNQFDWSLSQE